MILLSEKSKQRFILSSEILLIGALILLLAGLITTWLPSYAAYSAKLIRAGIITILIATPTRLLILGHLLRTDGHLKSSLVALALVFILIVGALAKLYLL